MLLLCAVGRLVGVPSRATAAPTQSIASSDTTVLGVVWTPPAPTDSALRELNRIDRVGATAVRLTRLPSDTVAARATTLGLRLYVDLPVDHIPASQLRDALKQVQPGLERLQALARRHRAITHVGLARGAETTAPAACDVLRAWTDRLRKSTLSIDTYYVTPFAPTVDRCAGAVDRVLLDLRGHPAPAERWHQWQSQTQTAGIGALGTWMYASVPPGLQTPHSSERQARYLEHALSGLLDSSRTSPPTLFVARWQDQASPLLPTRHYGLHRADGAPRPAARVVQGFYTGTQRVFAFPSGPKLSLEDPGLLLFGWGLVVLLGGLYAQSLFVRQTVARYFRAPGFYRDALRDGHDLSAGANGLLLAILAGALGTAALRTAELAASSPAAEHVLATLPPPLQITLGGALEHPIAAGIAVGGSTGALLLTWATVLVLLARGWTRFSPPQALMLVVWPCWPVLLALPLALATGPDAPLSPAWFGLLLLGGAPLVLLSITGRVLFDYWAVTDLPAWPLLLAVALSPPPLGGIALIALTAGYDLSFPFLWHLATHT